jgi:hypothetical protein
MFEFSINDINYRAGKLNAFQQLHVSRKIAPIVPKLLPAFLSIHEASQASDESDLMSMVDAFAPAAEAMSAMPEADCEYVFGICLSVVSRQQGNSWSQIWQSTNKALMFDDIDLAVMTQIVVKVIGDSLGNFIRGLFEKAQSNSPAVAQ